MVGIMNSGHAAASAGGAGGGLDGQKMMRLMELLSSMAGGAAKEKDEVVEKPGLVGVGRGMQMFVPGIVEKADQASGALQAGASTLSRQMQEQRALGNQRSLLEQEQQNRIDLEGIKESNRVSALDRAHTASLELEGVRHGNRSALQKDAQSHARDMAAAKQTEAKNKLDAQNLTSSKVLNRNESALMLAAADATDFEVTTRDQQIILTYYRALIDAGVAAPKAHKQTINAFKNKKIKGLNGNDINHIGPIKALFNRGDVNEMARELFPGMTKDEFKKNK